MEKCVKIGGVTAHIIKDNITMKPIINIKNIPFNEVNTYEELKISIKNNKVVHTISAISNVAFMVMCYIL